MSTQNISAVPMLDLKRQYKVVGEQMNNILREVNESGQFVLGPEVKKFEENIAKYTRVEHAVGCASGSDALLLSLMAADVGFGDEVLTPSFTFFASASCIPRVGAVPVFVDIESESFNLDPNDVAQKINEKTKAIIVVHLYGQAANMPEIQKVVREAEKKYDHKIFIVEDSCQAIGAEINGVPVGNWGDFSCLSFYPTKNLGGCGDGGMVLCNDQKLATRVRVLRAHGSAVRYYHEEVGINSRLDSYQAAVLNVKLPYLDSWAEARKTHADLYEKLFAENKLLDRIVPPKTGPNRRHVWNNYTIRVLDGKRDELRAFLVDNKIGCDIYYPLGLHEQKCFAHLGYKPEELPETNKATKEVLAIPVYPELTAGEQEFVVEKIRLFFNK